MGEISARDAVEMADEAAGIGDEAALVELLLRGCAYVASNETIEDGHGDDVLGPWFPPNPWNRSAYEASDIFASTIFALYGRSLPRSFPRL